VGAAVAFLTPVATPANMMVMGPAGYRFGDYWRLGLPLVGLFGVVSVLLVAGMIPLATAVTTSGAGELVATMIVDAVGEAGPLALLAALFVITVVFGQLISNTATALVMIPIAVSAAQQLDISARPVLMSLCVGAAVAFLTPVATPANMMVMGPAGYRFGDYWRLGLPLVGLFGVVSVLLVPVIWAF